LPSLRTGATGDARRRTDAEALAVPSAEKYRPVRKASEFSGLKTTLRRIVRAGNARDDFSHGQRVATVAVVTRSPWVIGLVCLAFAACSSARPLAFQSAEDLRSQLEPGDKVRITTHDGRKLKFEVREVTEDAVVGENESVATNEIRTIERVDFSRTKTTIFGLSTAAVVVVVGLFTALAIALSQADWSEE
jgi:hypothetical protein